MENLTYEKFIQNILDTRGRFACGDEYHERHHIIPKCCGGGNETENLIDLYAREHFIAHKLLASENPENNSLTFAWTCMAFPNTKEQKRYELTPEEYEEARITLSKAMTGENHPNYGKHPSEETRKKMSNAHKGEKHYLYGKHVSEDQKNKQSKSMKGKMIGENNPMYDVHRYGEDNPMYGKHHSEESRKKLSEAKKEQFTNKENHPMYGKHHSEETKKKLHEANGRIVLQFNKNTKLVKIWGSIKQVSNELNIERANITKCCTGSIKTAGGYKWCYLYDQTRKDGTVIPGAITLGLITEEEALKMLEEQKETNN